MIAARVEVWGEPPRIHDVPTPACAPGESLVRMHAATVAHLDLTVATGDFPLTPALPYTPGVEGAGEIVESASLPPGTRVTIRGAGIGMTRDGTWAELACVPDEALHPWPEGMGAALASAFYVPATTAHLALHDVGRVTATDDVLVVGAFGAVGSLAAQLAQRAGARVTRMASNPTARGAAPGSVLDTNDPATAADLAERRPFSLMIDTVGGDGLAERLTWVRPGGRTVIVGYTHGTSLALDLPSWLLADVAVLPVNTITRAAAADACAPGLAALLVAGDLTLATTEFTLGQAPAAVEALTSGRGNGRVVLLPGG